MDTFLPVSPSGLIGPGAPCDLSVPFYSFCPSCPVTPGDPGSPSLSSRPSRSL